MKVVSKKNINTPEYFNKFFRNKKENIANVLRQRAMLEYYEGGTAIELGCGMSPLVVMLKEKSPRSRIYGLDFSVEAIKKMAENHSNINWVVGDATVTQFIDNNFDYVFAGELIEHIENPQYLVEEMVRIIKPRGMIVVSTPQLEFKDKEHLWEFSPTDLYKMFYHYGDTKIKRIKSEIFRGRSYLILSCYVKK